jgi:hypothetical protein
MSIEDWEETFDDYEENMEYCTECSGYGWVHGCWDDCCRAGKPAIERRSARACRGCGGDGVRYIPPQSYAAAAHRCMHALE